MTKRVSWFGVWVVAGFLASAETSGCATVGARCFFSNPESIAGSVCVDGRTSFCHCGDDKIYACVDGRAASTGLSCSGDVEHDEHATLDDAAKPSASATETRIVKLPEGRMDVFYPDSANAQLRIAAIDATGRLTTAFGPGAFDDEFFDIHRGSQTLPLFSRAFGTARDGCGILKNDGTLLCWTWVYQGKAQQQLFQLGKAARGKKILDVLLEDGCWTDGAQARCEGDPNNSSLEQKNAVFASIGVRRFVDKNGYTTKIIDKNGALRACSGEGADFECEIVAAAAGLRLVEVAGDCGLDETSRLVCWGDAQTALQPTGAVSAVTTDETGRLCLIDGGADAKAKCWSSALGNQFAPFDLGAAPTNLIDLNANGNGSHGFELVGLDKAGNAHTFSFSQESGFNRHALSTFPVPSVTCVYPPASDGTTMCGSLELARDEHRSEFERACTDAGGSLDKASCADRVKQPLRWLRLAPTAEAAFSLGTRGPAVGYWVFGPLTGSSEQRCAIGEYATAQSYPGACFP